MYSSSINHKHEERNALLDDLKYIHQKDTSDALGIAQKQWQQYGHNYHFEAHFPKPIHKVVVAGMGGSGLAAKMFNSWPGLSVPLTIVQDYDLPAFVDEQTLLICSSYSGNTEETIAVLQAALALKPRPPIVVIDSGGKLQALARQETLPIVVLPAHMQPRMTFGYQLRALTEVLEQANLVDGGVKELESAAEWLGKQMTDWLPTVPTSRNPVKQLAQELVGKSVVVYAGPKLAPAAYKWKISLNENAKNIAWWDALPEFNHNEFLGWTSHPRHKPYAVIDLRSNLEHPRVQKRFEVTERLLSGKRPAPHIVNAAGQTLLQQLIWTIALGDFTSLYVALLNGLDPTPVELIEKFKASLDQ